MIAAARRPGYSADADGTLAHHHCEAAMRRSGRLVLAALALAAVLSECAAPGSVESVERRCARGMTRTFRVRCELTMLRRM